MAEATASHHASAVLERRLLTLAGGERVSRQVAAARDDAREQVAEAIELLDQLHPPAPKPPPLVELRPCYSISLDDPIFEEFGQATLRGCER